MLSSRKSANANATIKFYLPAENKIPTLVVEVSIKQVMWADKFCISNHHRRMKRAASLDLVNLYFGIKVYCWSLFLILERKVQACGASLFRELQIGKKRGRMSSQSSQQLKRIKQPNKSTSDPAAAVSLLSMLLRRRLLPLIRSKTYYSPIYVPVRVE